MDDKIELTKEEALIQESLDETIGSVSVNENVPGSYKQEDNSEQNLNKHQAIAKLKRLSYRTPATEIYLYLNIIFGRWEEKPEHWLYIAQHYTPKTINSVIAQIIKQHQRKDISIKNPGAYFSSVIKYRPKRKIFRPTNDLHKQNKL